MSKSVVVCAVIGLSLTALLLTGSSRVATHPTNPALPPALVQVYKRSKQLQAQSRYFDARASFLRASQLAQKLGFAKEAAQDMAEAGICQYATMNFRGAQKDFELGLALAQSSSEAAMAKRAQNNLATLYLHIGQPGKALQLASEALSSRTAIQPDVHGKLLYAKAGALADLNRLPEAEPVYRQSIEELMDLNDLDSAARIEADLGTRYLKAGRLDESESTLSGALALVRIHRLNASPNLLSSLAELKSRRGDMHSANVLFEEAINSPVNLSPVWLIRSRRARFRLENGDLPGALEDFREARRVALEMRADIVPADQDRVALEKSELSGVIEGLVDAGNRLATATGDLRVLQETFDAAEQDRLWSLRALVPNPNDWRSRLPEHYWEVLAQYQSLERTAVVGRSAESSRGIESLGTELQRIEADSAAETRGTAIRAESPLAHAQAVIGGDSVVLSFLITETSGWVWTVDRKHAAVFPLAAPAKIRADAAAFTKAVRGGAVRNSSAREIYRDLFGGVPPVWLNHPQWLIEPDGPLNDLPFAALVTGAGEYAVERAAIESIPGALLLERGGIPAGASFVGIGDPIYNGADPRYRQHSARPDLTLPRLPNTAAEIEACARVWGSKTPVLLSGAGATPGAVEAAVSGNAAIVHFATHVITEPGEFRSGLIALSLDASGAMGLLGPKEIVARPVSSSLIVMNGCHSAQGETLPSAGLMGLTRAWIGAGAKAVIATGWDVPDAAAQSFMSDFYGALREEPEHGPSFALRAAQLKAIRRGGERGADWAAYFLLSRLQ